MGEGAPLRRTMGKASVFIVVEAAESPLAGRHPAGIGAEDTAPPSRSRRRLPGKPTGLPVGIVEMGDFCSVCKRTKAVGTEPDGTGGEMALAAAAFPHDFRRP